MSETARLAVVVACYGGVGASLVFHVIWFRIAAARLVDHLRDHHPDERARYAGPATFVGWKWLWRPARAAEACAGFVALRRSARIVVGSFSTTALVLIATAQAFWSTLS